MPEVPPSLPGVVTVTSTTPVSTPAGAVACSVVAEVTVTSVAAVAPKETLAPGTNEVPVTVTTVPPAIGPAPGLSPVTVGGPYANRSSGLVADGTATVSVAVTTTSTDPPVGFGGAVAVSVVSDVTVTSVAGAVPKATVVDPTMKPVPVIVTAVPPATGPTSGLTAVTVGAVSAAAGAAVRNAYEPRGSREAIVAKATRRRRGSARTPPDRRPRSTPRSPVHRCPMLRNFSPLEPPPHSAPHRCAALPPVPPVGPGQDRRGRREKKARDVM